MLLLSRSLGFIAAVCTLGAAANPTKRAGCSSTLTSATVRFFTIEPLAVLLTNIYRM